MDPSLKALRVFETAARHASFKAAAEEMKLTPTAISHQVRSLEATLGHCLFLRKVRQVELTTEGEELARTLGPAFHSIDSAIGKLMRQSNRHTVTLGAGPIYAARWLAPRLGLFWREHPDLDLRLHHSPLPVHQQMERYDLAVAWGQGDWPGLHSELLLRIEVTPIHAPSLLSTTISGVEPNDLLDMPLLQHRDQAGWQQWLTAAGVKPPETLPGPMFEDANVLLQAILEGQGLGLGILPLISDEIVSGRLVKPFEINVEPKDSYYLLYPPENLKRDAVHRVRNWFIRLTI